MNKSRLLGAVCAVLFSFITMSANATLHGRLPLTPGGTDYQAAYDDVLDITWVTNANLSGNNTWDNQEAWASHLHYLGFNDWRLASMSVAAGLPTGSTTSVIDCSTATELACRDNELGYMFYYNMGGSYGDDKTGDQTVDGVLLTDVQTGNWSGTEFDSYRAWYFFFSYVIPSDSGSGSKHYTSYGWAVRDGDVSATLHGRLPLTPGGTDYQAAYDDVLDITWVTNGALSPKLSWQPQVDWAANLNYLGYDDWRLASMAVSAGLPTGAAPSVVSCSSATELACRDNELGYMFYQNMGGTIGDTLTGNQTVDGVLLSNVQGGYWSGTEFATNPAGAWFFTFIAYPGGHYGVDPNKGSGFSGWAVRDGDVQENPDADGDGVNDDEDLCPDTAPEAAVDAVGCSDAQVDGDGDGVCNDGAVSNGPSTCVGADACPGTVIPEGVPTVRLDTNRWALVDDDFEFDTTAPNGKGPDRSYSSADTGGCSCEQIIGALGLGTGQEKFGCSISTMDGWVALPR